MNLQDAIFFTEVDYALEEAQFLVETTKAKHSVIQANGKDGMKFYVIPTEFVLDIRVIETFSP